MVYTLVQVISFWSVWLLRMGQLTQRELELVIELTRAGISARRIALRLRCSKRTIQRVRQRFRLTGSSDRLPGTGRAAKTTAREDRYLGRLAAGHRFNTLGALTAMFNDQRAHPVSHWTVRRRLHLQGTRSRVAARKPLISLANRQRRIRWATRTLPWTADEQWAMLVFSDESRFNLSYNDGRVRVWRTHGERFLPECLSQIQKNTTQSVMVWGCIGRHGVGELVVLTENVTAAAYIRTLEANLLNSVENIFGHREHRFIFQHDNAPAHTARATQAWLEANNIQTIQWPAQSPDLNVIENLWDNVGRVVTRERPATRVELINVLHRAWNSIRPDTVARLFDSLPRRVRAVVRSRGYPTRY